MIIPNIWKKKWKKCSKPPTSILSGVNSLWCWTSMVTSNQVYYIPSKIKTLQWHGMWLRMSVPYHLITTSSLSHQILITILWCSFGNEQHRATSLSTRYITKAWRNCAVLRLQLVNVFGSIDMVPSSGASRWKWFRKIWKTWKLQRAKCVSPFCLKGACLGQETFNIWCHLQHLRLYNI